MARACNVSQAFRQILSETRGFSAKISDEFLSRGQMFVYKKPKILLVRKWGSFVNIFNANRIGLRCFVGFIPTILWAETMIFEKILLIQNVKKLNHSSSNNILLLACICLQMLWIEPVSATNNVSKNSIN